jgi:hypothetical protein
MWSSADALDCVENLSDKIRTGLGAPLPIPVIRAFDFQPCERMKTIRLSLRDKWRVVDRVRPLLKVT